ncbi:uncharacterized protein BYT42DRAFT_552775 [Radiomyces spectabilis]|uniref:uncharacterized protein n=1 Tax=Radiomyces spectabilis TaxID=64574 RepID=UPI00221E5B90|nr:uncharacterized protein BYT42DRAFT_552775 [Radiomyces spectabilis]KAI8393938.1 hypothetical protein BYT42DRAFT_552775 [Radiomyces spectabilis]
MDSNEYYNIDSILAEHTRIPCIFLHNISADVNLTGDGTEITRQSRLELPFWLVKPFAEFTLPDNSQLISLEIPKAYGTRVRNVLEAGPTNVDFRLLCPYFYLFGMKLLKLVVDDSLAAILEKAFKTRIKEIMDYSQTGTASLGHEFLQKLDETEKELFKAGQESAHHLRLWRNRSFYHLRSVDINARPLS